MVLRPALFACLLVLLVAGHDTHALAAPTGTRYLYLIRHGMYDRDAAADDRVGNGLNALGREQATLIGARLAHLPVTIAALTTSDFTRARETANAIGRELHLTPAVDTLLHECTPESERADLTRDAAPGEAAACDSQLVHAWTAYVRPVAGEADEHDVLVCHGNVIRWFVTRALGADPRHWSRLDIANASLTILAVRPDGAVLLVTFSDASHVPIAQQTWSGRGAGWGKR